MPVVVFGWFARMKEYHRSLDTGDADRPLALGKTFPPLSPVAAHSKVMAMPSNLVKGKSMPSLR